jgi:2-C-methyl-D-erythritol 2,4-cyclodiphosphate synthase
MYRIGYAEDIHRLVAGRKLMIGGIHIEYPVGEDAHSDGDVLLHAISESLLGALALGDLGTHFPADARETENIDSKIILTKTYDLVKNHGYEIVNIDSTIILEKPKLSTHIEAIRKSICETIGASLEQISVKACTNEKLGAIGENKAIKATSIVLLRKI